jgi:electron transfer flavoprotein alpha subunit
MLCRECRAGRRGPDARLRCVRGAFTSNGKNIAPRVAALLDVMQVSDILSVESADTFTRPIYAGNAIATVQSSDTKKVITVRGTAFEKAAREGGRPLSRLRRARMRTFQLRCRDRPVRAPGTHLGQDHRFRAGERWARPSSSGVIDPLADKLGAGVGASRAGRCGMRPTIIRSQTGKIVAPEVYVAVGISGAIQHLAGMKDSKTIVAINKGGRPSSRSPTSAWSATSSRSFLN